MCGAFEIVLVRLAQSLTFTRKGRTMHFWHRLKIEGAGWSIVLFVTVMELFQFLCFWGLPDPFCPSSRAVELGATTGGWWLLPTGFHFHGERCRPQGRSNCQQAAPLSRGIGSRVLSIRVPRCGVLVFPVLDVHSILQWSSE